MSMASAHSVPSVGVSSGSQEIVTSCPASLATRMFSEPAGSIRANLTATRPDWPARRSARRSPAGWKCSGRMPKVAFCPLIRDPTLGRRMLEFSATFSWPGEERNRTEGIEVFGRLARASARASAERPCARKQALQLASAGRSDRPNIPGRCPCGHLSWSVASHLSQSDGLHEAEFGGLIDISCRCDHHQRRAVDPWAWRRYRCRRLWVLKQCGSERAR